MAVSAELQPGLQIGYVGGGADQVGQRLEEMGAEVRVLTFHDIEQGRFEGLGAIVLGVFSYRTRPELQEHRQTLRAFMETGGTVISLYHRPWDNWHEDTTPPLPIKIGAPSLRWRVTDEQAEVIHLDPAHPLVQYPNTLGPEDWKNWVKERGLYFAAQWDPAYTPLLSMSDPDEEALTGALLAADIGQGRYVHTALALHTQLDHLVPGAYRLMANLLTPRETPDS